MNERMGEKISENNAEAQKSLISHFVGNWLLNATGSIEDGESADEIRKELIEKLEAGPQGTIVDGVLDLIRKSDWSTKQGLESFRETYLAFEVKHGITQ